MPMATESVKMFMAPPALTEYASFMPSPSLNRKDHGAEHNMNNGFNVKKKMVDKQLALLPNDMLEYMAIEKMPNPSA